MPQIYHIQMHLPYGREDGTTISPKDMLREPQPVIGTGEWDHQQCRSFKNAPIGSIVLVREGNTPIALVEIVSETFQDSNLEPKYLHRNYRYVKVLSWKAVKNPRSRLFSQGTFSICNSWTEQYKYIMSWYKQSLKDRKMETIIKILESNHNLILTGAPGTGKTYLAQQIAKKMGCKESQIGFVQFHPSYDYTDFVEGLRPTQDRNGNIGFEPKDGIFKKFCEKALSSYLDGKDAKYVFIIDEINRGEISKIFGELFFSIDPGYRVTKQMIEKHKSGNAPVVTIRTQYSNMCKNPNEFDKALDINDKKDYGHFFVPENVYVIGTMNDIDRSVESMDFAFRRRFAFTEIKAGDNTGMLDGMYEKDKIINRMNNLNAKIAKVESLSSAYQIGGSYFLKLKLYQNEDKSYNYDALWNNHLEGLLREYLRGTPNVDNIIEQDLKPAYNDVANHNG